MKWSIVLPMLVQVAWPQVQTGTAVAVIPFHEEISIATDSRASSATGYKDTQCKIAAFGHKFVLVIAGFSDTDGWNGNSIGRQIWSSVNESDPAKEVEAVITQFVSRMKVFIYAHPDIVQEIQRRHPESHTVASVFAAATAASGQLAAGDIEVTFDRDLVSKNGFTLNDKPRPIEWGHPFFMGNWIVMAEFANEVTPRAQKYRQWFDREQTHLLESQRWPMFAAKLVELAVLFDQDGVLGFPIDVVQITPSQGVIWVRNEKHCPEE